MSSTAFSTELTPEPCLRLLVVGSGAAMLVLGLIVATTLSTSPGLRLTAATAWLWLGARQLLAARRNHSRVCRMRLYADGSAAIAAADGQWRAASLAAGSVVLGRVAWLRFELESGRCIAELVAGDPRESQHWRRLQVIWRHLGSAA